MRPVSPSSVRRLRAALLLCAALGFAAPAWSYWSGGADVRVNQDLGIRNQNETAIAVNPAVPGNLLMVYNDVPWPGGLGLGYSYSFDSGATWADGRFAHPMGMVQYHDPMAAADLNGRLYAGGCVNNNVVNGSSVLLVYTSTDGGITWSAPMAVSSDGPQVPPALATLNDRGHLVVDRHATSPHANRAYVAWIKDVGSSGPFSDTWFSASPGGGAAFAPRQRISDLPAGQSRSHAPHVAAAADGSVYVVWADYDITVSQGPATFFVDRSTDGGATFGADVSVAAGVITVPNVFTSSIGPDTDGDTAPVIATNPLLPNEVYVVYNADPDGPFIGDEGDIYFVKSVDGGATWGAPAAIPANWSLFRYGTQYAPWIDVKPDGTIDVAWYSHGHLEPAPGPLYWYVVMTQSRDGGATWAEPLVVSEFGARSPRNPFNPAVGWLGEYLALAVDSTWAHLGWSDARGDSLGDLYYDRVKNLVFRDCDRNGWADHHDLSTCGLDPRCQDCNRNQVLDGCDIDATDPDGDGRVSLDTDGDLVPDECAGSGVGGGGSGRLDFHARPSLTGGPARFHFGRALPAGGTVTLFDASGRVVRVLAVAPGAASVAWDGKDAAGRRVGTGTYFARLACEAGGAGTRIVVAR
jgi:hypothetical protein